MNRDHPVGLIGSSV